MSENLRVVAIDDERPALQRLEAMLANVEGANLVGTAMTGRAGLKMIQELHPDAVLLDIAMPGLSGLELADRLGSEASPAIIFITAYDHHAVAAFDRNAVDYLLKPVDASKLLRALDRARNRTTNEERAADLARLRQTIASLDRTIDSGPTFVREFWGHRQNELVRVPVDSLLWVEADRDYVRLHHRYGFALLHDTISNVLERLDPAVFTQIHRSVIVRTSAVVSARRGITGVLIAELVDGTQVNAGRKYAKNLAGLVAKLALQDADKTKAR